MYQPKISEADLKQRIADRAKPIPAFEDEVNKCWYIKLPNGARYKWTAGTFDPFGVWFSYTQDFEKDYRNRVIIDKIVKYGTNVLDIGALVGAWTLPCLAVGAKVTSIELDPRYYKDMWNNVHLNNFQDNWTGQNVGVYSEDCVEDFYDLENATFRQIDNLNLPHHIDFVKMDIEGGEYEAFKGGLNYFLSTLPNFFVECHIHRDPQMHIKIMEFIKRELAADYVFELTQMMSDCIHLLALRPTRENLKNHIMRRFTFDELIDKYLDVAGAQYPT